MKIQFENEGLIILESALFRTTTTIIYSDVYILLIDPNWLPIEIAFIKRLAEKHGHNKAKYLLFTHSDYDHIIGYGAFKGFETIASQNFVSNTEAEDILKQINNFDDENYIKRGYEITYPKIDLVIPKDHQSLVIGNDEYFFYQAVGHNKDGIITFNKSRGILIVGDYLSNIEFPYIYESLAEYNKTLGKLSDLIKFENVEILISGHGDFTNNLDEMNLRIKESKQYLSEIENSIKMNRDFDFSNLFNRYDFPGIMMKFHEGNVKVVRNEIFYD